MRGELERTATLLNLVQGILANIYMGCPRLLLRSWLLNSETCVKFVSVKWAVRTLITVIKLEQCGDSFARTVTPGLGCLKILQKDCEKL